MYYSRYNLLLPMKENPRFPFAIMNSLSGSFDLVQAGEKDKLAALAAGKSLDDPEFIAYLLRRGYLFEDAAAEEKRLLERRPEFDRALRDTPPQVLFIPTYGCNLACPYCYQNGIKDKIELVSQEVVDGFFAHLKAHFTEAKPFITLFGGEALIGSPRQKEMINYIAGQAAAGGYAISAVSNGYDLLEYLDILQQAEIKEIQVTLDGPQAVHDSRRHTANGQGTFQRILSGVEEAVRRGIPINLRAVVDKSNFEDLVTLAAELDARGWLDLPLHKFKTQIGRNYELFECYAAPQHLLGQAEHWAMFLELAQRHPVLKKFHQPEFKGINHLVQSGELYLPSYDTCPACKTEWVYDLYGNIYGCTATAGQDKYIIGKFYPEFSLNQAEVEQWQERNILTIPECRTCDVSLVCGGGCGAVAHQQQGRIQAPDCRPIKEILTLGLQYYGDQLLQMGY